jgi:drug/metabolite transporter (DMT)-like permease
MLFSTIFILIINISKQNRLEIIKAWPVYKSKISWFVLSELLQMVAMGLAMFAMIHLPLTIITGLNQFQPIFVLLVGVLVLLVNGKNYNEVLDKKNIMHKLFCFILMVIGAILLVQ